MSGASDSGINSSVSRPEGADILLIDDDPDVREALVGALEDEGYAVAEAADGSAALQQLKNAPIPQLIILDLNMPRLAGSDFRRESLQQSDVGAVPLLVVSADADAKGRAEAMGAQGFLPKPVRLGELFATVARLLTSWGGRRGTV